MNSVDDLRDYEKLDIDPEQVSRYMKTVGYRILILPDFKEKVTKGGIILAEQGDNHRLEEARCDTGVVVSIGPMAFKGIKGYDFDSGGPWCKVGDHVVYGRYGGRFQFDPILTRKNGEPVKYIVVNDEDIQLILDDEVIEEIRQAKEEAA